MSAITGMFFTDGRDVDPDLFKKMNNTLRHRGPDGSGIWIEGPVALGHQMLHTTPESLQEKLPFEDEDSGIVITSDARIDNRDELSTLLKIENSEKVADSLFILKSYQKWGDKCPEKLLGDFAFAIWDPVNEQLFCARDHMGIKPFYYYHFEDVFYFATEMKALYSIPDIPMRLNDLKVVYYFINEFIDRKLTFYQNINRLGAAHTLKIYKNNFLEKKFWNLNPDLFIEFDSEEEYIQTFREIFAESIRCRLRTNFSLGFELSGGLDSSSIVCMAKKILNDSGKNESLKTFSYVINGNSDINVTNFIEKVVNMGGIKPNFIQGDKIGLLEDMATILKYQEQPNGSPNTSIFWNLYKKMHEKNVRVFLSGDGGDEVGFRGQNYFKDLLANFKLIKLIKEITNYSKRSNQTFTNVFFRKTFFPLLPVHLKDFVNQKFLNKNQRLILTPKFVDKFGGETYLRDINESYIKAAKTVRTYHYYVLNELSNQSVHEPVNMVCSAFSIEPRYPFRDKRLIEFAYGIPDDMKFKFGWDRYLHRVAMTGILPKEIQWRSKHLVAPRNRKNRLISEKNYLDEMIKTNDGIIENYLNSSVLKDAYKKFLSGNDEDSGLLWMALIFYFWLQENESISVT
jgi:asparagine synthase (glutamine-hydrolysing)